MPPSRPSLRIARGLWLLAAGLGLPYRAGADVFHTYTQRSLPQGLVPDIQGAFYPPDSLVRSAPAPLTTGGRQFAGWRMNGVFQSDAAGQARFQFEFSITTNSIAEATYLLPTEDLDLDGAADHAEWRHYGSLANTPASDTDLDGFTHAVELARGYTPAVRDELRDGGVLMRLSETATLRDASLHPRYEIRSDPQGLVTGVTGNVPPGTPVNSPALVPGLNQGGFIFGFWQVNGVRQADGSGLALSRVSLVVTQDVSVVARFFPAAQDSDADGLADWEEANWFGHQDHTPASDPDGDGLSIARERARGYTPGIFDDLRDGGLMLRQSEKATLRNDALYSRHVLRSDPQGLVTEISGHATNGTRVTTGTFSGGSVVGGFAFGYWQVNGVRQADGSGLALPGVSVDLAGDAEIVARFFPATADTDADGLLDWREWHAYGHLGHSLGSDSEGDGFSIAEETRRGYGPTIRDDLRDGGVMLRLSTPGTLRDSLLHARYTIRSDPQGLVADVSAIGAMGTEISTVALAGGAGTGGFAFGFWEVNGIRQADGGGLALPRVVLTLTQDVDIVARHFPATADTDADGWLDWQEWNSFGGLAFNLSSDPDADGFSIAQERARGYAPGVRDDLRDGGILMRLSEPAQVALPFFPRVTLAFVEGRLQPAFAALGGGTSLVHVAENAAPALGDWDDDGDLDLFLGGKEGALRIYENAGSPLILDLHERTANFSPLHPLWTNLVSVVPALGDWSGDGRADLVVAGQGSLLKFAASPSGVGMDVAQTPLLSGELDMGLPVTAPALAVAPGQTRADLYLLLADGTVDWHANTLGTGVPFASAPTQANLLPEAVPSARGLAIVDADEDGDLDVQVSDSAGRIWLFTSDGAGGFTRASQSYGGSSETFAHSLTLAAGDVDGDGDPDVMGGFEEGGLLLLRNPAPRLLIGPPSSTLLSGASLAFTALNGQEVAWALLRNRSGGAIQGSQGLYQAGPTPRRVDVIEGVSSAGLRGRAYVNVISAADVTAAGKSVIIAGGRSLGDPVWKATDRLADFAYGALLYRASARAPCST